MVSSAVRIARFALLLRRPDTLRCQAVCLRQALPSMGKGLYHDDDASSMSWHSYAHEIMARGHVEYDLALLQCSYRRLGPYDVCRQVAWAGIEH